MPKYHGFIRTTDAGMGTSDMYPIKSDKPFILLQGLVVIGEFDTKVEAYERKAGLTRLDAHSTYAEVREFKDGGEFVQA